MEGKGQRDPMNPRRLGQSKETVPWLSAAGVPTRAPPFPPGGPPQASNLTKPPVQDPPPKSAQWKDNRAGTTQRCRRARTLPKHFASHPGASGGRGGRLGPAGPDQGGRTGPQSWAPEARARGRHPGRPDAQAAPGRAGPPRPSLGVPPARAGGEPGRQGPGWGRGSEPGGGIGRGPAQASGRPGGRGPAPRGTGGARRQPGRGPNRRAGEGGRPGRTGPQAAPGRRSPRPCPSGRSGPWRRREARLAGWLARSLPRRSARRRQRPLRPPQEVPSGRPRSASAAPAAAT